MPGGRHAVQPVVDDGPRGSLSADPGRVLHPDTTMDAVTLRVGDLQGMSSYYERALVLAPVEERARGREVHRVLGRRDVPMVRLVHTPGLEGVDPRQAGLFHTAFLFEDPAALAAAVYRAFDEPRSRFVGSSDHHVSEAFYFTDPEGNGIELYADRPRSQWQRRSGEIQFDTTRLDARGYLADHLTQQSLDAGPALAGQVGHVHLQVGELRRAEAFYLGVLGFESTFRGAPGALFASAGGYHHHVAMNVWNSAGAGPRAATLGLGEVAITVPSRQDLEALATRLKAARVPYTSDGRSIGVVDPWDTHVTVSLPGTTADDRLSR